MFTSEPATLDNMSSVDSPKVTDQPDHELLRHFVKCRDEASLSEIIKRHCQLVLSVCRRVTGDIHDADDAFQATFLVLARSARKIRKPESLSSWLYGVAYRISMRINKRRSKERRMLATMDMAEYEDPFRLLSDQFAQQKTDQELHDLPESLRAPMVLRYLCSKSNSQIADELGLSVSAVEGRLKRAKRQMRVRLARHGITVSTLLAGMCIHRSALADAGTEELIQRTLMNCMPNSSASGITNDNAASTAAQLANEEIIAMTSFSGTKLIAIGLCGLVAVSCGALAQVADSSGGNQGSGDLTTVLVQAVDESPGEDSLFELESPTTENANPFDFDDSVASADTPASDDSPFTDTAVASDESSKDSFGNASSSGASTNASPVQPAIRQRTFDFKRSTPNEIRIDEALGKNTRVEFFGFTLGEAIDYFRQTSNVNVQLDNTALQKVAVTIDTSIPDRSLSGIRLCDTLDLVLHDVGLTWVPTNDVLLITSPDRARTILETRAYGLTGITSLSTEEIGELLQATVVPDSWEKAGGEGTFVAKGNLFFIRQTYRCHNKISELLEQIATADENKGGKATGNQRDSRASR